MKALLLCAGFGTRLNDLTRNLPKPMLPLKGRPLLEYTIGHLKRFGIDELVINLHYLPEAITGHFGDGRNFGVTITYSYEDEPLGTAGALMKAREHFVREENFLVIYGDIVTDLDYASLLDVHSSNRSAATIVLHKRNKSNSIVEMDSTGRILRFTERPGESAAPGSCDSWVNSGIYCFNRAIFDFLPDAGYADFPRDIFSKLVDKKTLYGHPLTGYRLAVDSPDRYAVLQDDFDRLGLFAGI